MASKLGPRIVTDNLVLALDCADAKSYAGEPVTNLVTSTAVDFSVRSTYSGNTFSQVADSESPSGYACEMSYTGTVNSSSRCRFGAATNIPTSGTGFVLIWAKRSAGTSTMRPKVYTGYAWYHLEPLDGGSIYFTDEYRPFGVAVTFGTNSGGPNPGFSMTHAGGSTENDKTRWIKPQVTTLSYNIPFANLSRSATDGWVDLSGNSNDGTLVNDVATGTSHYRSGDVILPNSARYLDFDGSDDYVDCGSIGSMTAFTVELWINPDAVQDYQNPIDCNYSYNGTTGNIGPRLELRTGASPNWIISGDTGNNNAYYYIVARSGAPSTGTWYHAVLTYDGSGNTSGVKSYWDGSLVTSGLTNVNTPSAVWVNTMNNVELGHGFHLGSSRHFNGKIGSAKIYTQELTAAEVLENYNSTKSRFS